MAATVTYQNWSQISETFPYRDESKGARSVLEWAYNTYPEKEIVYASSFGAEAIVLIDLIQQIEPDAHIVFLDTGLHFLETYEVIDKIEARFPTLRIERKHPSSASSPPRPKTKGAQGMMCRLKLSQASLQVLPPQLMQAFLSPTVL